MKKTNWIMQYRKSAGLTQLKLAEAVGVTDHTIRDWENAKFVPSVFYGLLLAEALDTTVEELFGP